MKDQVLKLINAALINADSDFYSMQCRFGRMTDEELDKEYGQSGGTCRAVLNGYKKEAERLQACKEWFLSSTYAQ